MADLSAREAARERVNFIREAVAREVLPDHPEDLLTEEECAAMTEHLVNLARLRRTADQSGRMP